MRLSGRRTLKLLGGCWKVIILFEILYQLFSRYLVFPALRFVFNTCLRWTRVYYITAENITRLVTHPVLLGASALVFIVFSLTAIVEFSCLITCLHSARLNRAYGIVQVVIEGVKDAIRMLHPKNFLVLIVTASLIPLLQLPTASSMLRLVELPWSAVESYLRMFPYNLLGWAYILAVCALIYFVPCGYQFYTLEDLDGPTALRRAFAMNRRHRGRSFLGVIVCMTAALLTAYGGSALISRGVRRLTMLFTDDANLQYRIRLPFDTVLSFVKSGLPAVVVTAWLNSAYYTRKEWRRQKLPEQSMPFLPDARRYNSVMFWTAIALSALAMILYDTVLRPTLVRINAFDYLADRPTLVIAHRGDASNADENTMRAFRAAAEIGVDLIELDVQLTRDGEIIVNHDNTYRRVFGESRSVWQLTLEEAKALRGKKTGEAPPTLREVLTECDPTVNFLVELKDNRHDPGLPQAVFDLFMELDCFDRCMVQSSSYKMLREFKRLSPDTRCGYILSFALGHYSSLDSVDFFSLDSSFVTQKVLDRIHQAEKSLYVWTVNDDRLMVDMVTLGVDALITDDAPAAKNELLNLMSTPLDGLITAPLDTILDEGASYLNEQFPETGLFETGEEVPRSADEEGIA